MKIILKLVQFLFKFLSSIFSKLGATYTYNKIFKILMKYKIISILYNPLRIIFTNIIFIFKFISAIIAVLSLFNISLLYYNFDPVNESINFISDIIIWIRNYISKWFINEEDDEIPEPLEINKRRSRKEIKIIEKSVQSHNYWVIPTMLIGYGLIYYYNPNINLNEILDPLIYKIEMNIPDTFPTTFIMGTFIYKFITISITYITGYNLTNDENLPKDKPSSEDEPFALLTNRDKENLQNCLVMKGDKVLYENKTSSPTLSLSENEQDDINSLFPKDDEKTPKPSTSQLPEIRPSIGENPFKKTKILEKGVIKADEVHIEEW